MRIFVLLYILYSVNSGNKWRTRDCPVINKQNNNSIIILGFSSERYSCGSYQIPRTNTFGWIVCIKICKKTSPKDLFGYCCFQEFRKYFRSHSWDIDFEIRALDSCVDIFHDNPFHVSPTKLERWRYKFHSCMREYKVNILLNQEEILMTRNQVVIEPDTT